MVAFWRSAVATSGLCSLLQLVPSLALDDDLVEGNTVPGRNVPPIKGCTVTGMSYAPLNPRGTLEDHTMTSSWDWCQYQCQSSLVVTVAGDSVPCSHFAWYPDGQCFMQDDNVTLATDKWCNSTHPCTENNFQVVSGPANCSVTSLWVYPPTAGVTTTEFWMDIAKREANKEAATLPTSTLPITTTTLPPPTTPAPPVLPAQLVTLPPLPSMPTVQITTPAPPTLPPTVTITTTSTLSAASTKVGHPLELTIPTVAPLPASKDLPGFEDVPPPSPSPTVESGGHSTGRSPIFIACIFVLAFAIGGFVAYRKGLCGDRGLPCEFEDDEDSDEESGYRVAE